MDLHRELSYPADPYAVYAMMTDEAFLARRAVETKAERHEVTVERTGDGARTRTVRTMSVDLVPDALRKLAGDGIELTETTVWGAPEPDGARNASLGIEVAKAPVRLTGTLRIEAGSGGTHQRVDAEIKASIPLLGRKVEEACLKAINAALDVDERLGAEWLGG